MSKAESLKELIAKQLQKYNQAKALREESIKNASIEYKVLLSLKKDLRALHRKEPDIKVLKLNKEKKRLEKLLDSKESIDKLFDFFVNDSLASSVNTDRIILEEVKTLVDIRNFSIAIWVSRGISDERIIQEFKISRSVLWTVKRATPSRLRHIAFKVWKIQKQE